MQSLYIFTNCYKLYMLVIIYDHLIGSSPGHNKCSSHSTSSQHLTDHYLLWPSSTTSNSMTFSGHWSAQSLKIAQAIVANRPSPTNPGKYMAKTEKVQENQRFFSGKQANRLQIALKRIKICKIL